MIPYIPSGVQIQAPPKLQFTNISKNWANQNVCFTCGFNMEDWNTSVTCPNKKQGHQDGFTHSNNMEYEHANHQFCCKVMHKMMYPSMSQCGAMNSTDVKSVKCISLYYLSYPTHNIMVATNVVGLAEDDEKTIATSNSSTNKKCLSKQVNALMIKPTHVDAHM